MSRTITLDLPETVLDQLESEAKGRGMTAVVWIVLALTEQFTRPRTGKLPPATPSTPIPAGSRTITLSKDPRSVEEQEELRVRFRRHLGELNSVDPHSADNERIGADLARECSNSPTGED